MLDGGQHHPGLHRRPKAEFYKRSPFYRGAKEWNKLPPHIQVCDKKSSFKVQLRRFMGTYIKKPKKRKKKNANTL